MNIRDFQQMKDEGINYYPIVVYSYFDEGVNLQMVVRR